MPNESQTPQNPASVPQTPAPEVAPQPQQAYGQPQQPVVEDKSTLFIVLSVLEFFFCGGLFAIIPFVFSLQYKSALGRSDYAAAEDNKKKAKTWLIVALCIGIVLIIISVATGILGVLAASSSYSA